MNRILAAAVGECHPGTTCPTFRLAQPLFLNFCTFVFLYFSSFKFYFAFLALKNGLYLSNLAQPLFLDLCIFNFSISVFLKNVPQEQQQKQATLYMNLKQLWQAPHFSVCSHCVRVWPHFYFTCYAQCGCFAML